MSARRYSYSFLAGTVLLVVFASGIIWWGCAPDAPARSTDPVYERPQFTLEDLERSVHFHVNAFRLQHSREALDWNDRLLTVARFHSEDMARRYFFEHVSPDRKGPSDRAAEAGFVCRKEFNGYYLEGVGENIFSGYLYRTIRTFHAPGRQARAYDWYQLDELAERIVQAWANSEGHRKNLLSKKYDTQAIGVYVFEDGQLFVTQNFC